MQNAKTLNEIVLSFLTHNSLEIVYFYLNSQTFSFTPWLVISSSSSLNTSTKCRLVLDTGTQRKWPAFHFTATTRNKQGHPKPCSNHNKTKFSKQWIWYTQTRPLYWATILVKIKKNCNLWPWLTLQTSQDTSTKIWIHVT